MIRISVKISVWYILLCSCFVVDAQEYYFPPRDDSSWEHTNPQDLNWSEDKIEDLMGFLSDRNTKAFLVLVDGKIVLEEYFDSFTQDSLWYWASAGKSLASVLMGMAVEKGQLDLQRSSSDYLGRGWTTATPDLEDSIKVIHQMTMTSGLADNILACTEPVCLDYFTTPGSRWSYQNGPYTLTHAVMESATGRNFNLHTNLELAPIGLQGLWVPLGVNNVFFSKPRVMARFGSFVLNKMNWENWSPFESDDFYNAMTRPSQEINKSYGYLWWLHGQESHMLPLLQIVFDGPFNENCPSDAFSALGRNGQFLDIVPSLKMVVVRMGDAPDGVLVPVQFHRDMWEKLNSVIDQSTPIKEANLESISVFPNPAGKFVKIKRANDESESLIQFISATGKLLKSHVMFHKEEVVSLAGVPQGVIMITVDGQFGARLVVRD